MQINCQKCATKLYNAKKGTKYCSDCGFNIKKIRENLRSKKRYQKIKYLPNWRKRILVKYKGNQCILCGYNKCLAALSFHHTNPNDKLFTLDAKKLLTKNWNDILLEVNKTELMCCNCHCQEHQQERDSSTIDNTYTKLRVKYITRKLAAISQKGGKCSNCTMLFTRDNLQCANFHHLHNKSFSLYCDTFIRKSDKDIQLELDKTVLLCANCHMEKHHFKQ